MPGGTIKCPVASSCSIIHPRIVRVRRYFRVAVQELLGGTESDGGSEEAWIGGCEWEN